MDWQSVLAPEGRWSALVRAPSWPELVSRHCCGLIHLAAPYINTAALRDQWRMDRSVRASMRAAIEVARLAALGCTAISPAIVLGEIGHAGVVMDEPLDPLHLPFWRAWSQPLLNAASMVVVPAIDGWDSCPLVWHDVCFALGRNMPVHVYARGV